MLLVMTEPSILYQLIEARLDSTLADFVTARWPTKGWQKIADDIREATGLTVTRETLRHWFAERIEVRAFVRSETPASSGSAA